MSKTSERIRKEWEIGDAKRDEGLTTPEDIRRFDDLAYGPDPLWNLLDVYRPKDTEEKLPVIVNIHGGGWVYGKKEIYQFYAMSLAQRGFAVVNFNYRLAPEHQFPAQLDDLNLVIKWMYEYQNIYGLDMSHVFLVGDSAGAHLCGLYCAICTDKEYASSFPFTVPHRFVPEAVGLNCGVYRPLCEDTALGRTEDKDLMEDLLPEKGSERERNMVDVTRHVNAQFPPVYLMTCVGDFCYPQAVLLEQELKRQNVQYTFRIYGSEKEPLYHVFHVNMREPQGTLCNEQECAFFQKIRNEKAKKE